ncbi:MAG: serine/threonine-protein kinase [Kofleriaceae bacterium]
MRLCSACSTSTDDSGRFCPGCGAELAAAAGEAAATSSLIGSTIDGFAIDAILGRGSFGTVYRGRQVGLDRPVALKVPSHEIAGDPVMAKRFAREARAAARINHPGVVGIYAVGEVADGRPYLAMQLIDGQALDKILASGPISVDRALTIARLIASALSETHAADVVHRDLKPSNVVWRRDRNGDDRITLVDFGIAVCKPGNADATRLTTGGVIGTPHYMSPEQAHGDHVDARADLYALGCILFELVTGATPFAGSGFEVLLAHLGRPAPSASERNPSVPLVVDRLIMALMAKRPADRPQTADEVVALIDEVRAELAGQRVGKRLSRSLTAKRSSELDDGDDRPHRPRRRWWVVGILATIGVSAAAFAAIKAIKLADRGDPPAIAAGSTALPGSGADEDDLPSVFTGRRQLVVDDSEMSVRVTLYDPIQAGKSVRTSFELWDGLGAPFTAPHVVVTVEDEHGTASGFAAAASNRTPGRYSFRHVFPAPGRYVMRLFPPSAASEFQFELEVE